MTTPAAIEEFLRRLTASLEQDTFVRLVLSGPTPQAGTVERILGRCIRLRGQPHLSLTLRHPTRDLTQNHAAADAAGAVRGHLVGRFRSALLETTRRDWQLQLREDRPARLAAHPPHLTQPPSRQHDEPSETLLDAAAIPWLHALRITDAAGRVRPAMADKHRQIARYVEILSHLARDVPWPPGSSISIVDMGCGKGYLTFGAWHLFHHHLHLPARVVGVERRADLVAAANQVAHRIKAKDLEFQPGEIHTQPLNQVDLLIALHACNTATDDAIRRGIDQGARLIVVAPCCHQELRPQLGRPAPFAPALAHGLMQERMAEWLTDALRTLALEWAGFETRVIEFVGLEHTARNLMIAALLRRRPFTTPEARQHILDLKSYFGVKHQALDALLDRP